MPSTPNHALPYPLSTDPADVPTDMQELATATDTALETLETTISAAIPKSIVDAAGDLLVASGADTVARLAKGTNGHVLTAQAGAPGVGWAAPAAAGGGGAMALIEDKLLAADGPLDFTGIPATYKTLLIVGQVRAILGAAALIGDLRFRLNGDASALYDSQHVQGAIAAAAGGQQLTQTSGRVCLVAAQNAHLASASPFRLELLNYTGATFQKTWLSSGGDPAALQTAAGGQTATEIVAGRWRSAAVISRVTLVNGAAGDGPNFKAGSRATLYGIN